MAAHNAASSSTSGSRAAAGMFGFMHDGRPSMPPTTPYPLTHEARSSVAQIDMNEVASATSKARRVPMKASPKAFGDEDEDGGDAQGDNSDSGSNAKIKRKKRRRVVVACDTCRRKKVKCQGLPNPANTCNNCENMGYTCSFTVEPDRSRGRYEIVESQRDTLLMALRSVAPELAAQYERGELHITSPSGTLGKAKAPSSSLGANAEALVLMKDNGGSSLADENDGALHEAAAVLKHMSSMNKPEANPMVPDLEDGRPRYYGGSSSLFSFSEMDSRPPSPDMQGRRTQYNGYHGSHHTTAHEGSDDRGDTNMPDASRRKHHASSTSHHHHSLPAQQHSSQPPNPHPQRQSRVGQAKSKFAVLPPPMPQFPRNSIAWVRELRRKTLVAVGRDEIFADDGWFNKFPLPSQDLLDELLDFYFYRLHPLLPILHQDTLRRDLRSGRADRDSAFRGLIFCVLTIASRFFKGDPRVLADPHDPGSAGDHWAAASRLYHQVYAASLINVQVLLLSSTFMPSSLGMGTSWTVFGVAIRAMLDIGLHTEKAYVGYSPFEQERRRRTFWAAYCLDTVLSINMGRPSAIRQTDSEVKYPLLAKEEALTEAERSGGAVQELRPGDATPCVAGGFIHTIKVCALARDVINTIYQPGSMSVSIAKAAPSYKDMTILSKRLDEWVAETPPYMRDVVSSPYPTQAAFLQAGRNNVRLYILKPFIYDFRSGLPSNVTGSSNGSSGGNGMSNAGPSKSATGEDGSILRKMLLPQCTSHARGTLSALKALHEDVGVPVLYFLLHQSFLSASTFLLTVWHGTKDAQLLRTDSSLIDFTLRMYNGESKYASVLLQRAHRILRSVSLRCLSVLTDAGQRARLQDALRNSGASGGIAAATLHAIGGTGSGNAKSSQAMQSPSSTYTPTSATAFYDSSATTSGASPPAARLAEHRSRPSPSSHYITAGSPTSQPTHTSPSARRMYARHAPASPYGRLNANGDGAAHHHHHHHHHHALHHPFSPATNGLGSKHGSPRFYGDGSVSDLDAAVYGTSSLDALDLQQWLPLSGSPGANMRAATNEEDQGGAATGSFPFSGDHAWTDYFSRFLGELPDPISVQDSAGSVGATGGGCDGSADGSQVGTTSSITAGRTPDTHV